MDYTVGSTRARTEGLASLVMDEGTGRTRFLPVTELPSPLARIVQGALEAEGIPTRLEREALSAVYGLETGLFSTRVLVPEDRVQEAAALIADVESRD